MMTNFLLALLVSYFHTFVVCIVGWVGKYTPFLLCSFPKGPHPGCDWYKKSALLSKKVSFCLDLTKKTRQVIV